jgi:RNA polymerase sigma factor (sigma-70 family)
MWERDDNTDARLREWMGAAQQGDRAAYDHLLRTLVPIIRGVVRRQRSFLGDQDLEDIVQDVLLSIHTVRATYDPARPFLPWLMAIVRNRLADGGRRYAHTKAVAGIAEEFYETFQPVATNIDVDRDDEAAGLRHAITRLPEGQRRALELLKLREFSLKEAAHETGMSVAALKVAAHRAIKTLRKALKKEPQ